MFDKVLAALDTEEQYRPVFERSLALAQATGAELHLLGVINRDSEAVQPLMSYPGVTGYPLTISDSLWSEYQENYKQLKERGIQILSTLVREASARGVRAEFLQQAGEAGRAICDRAKVIEADLIVVGSHGRRGLDELLMGSISSYVMHRAPCSVMVVHDKSMRESTKTKNTAEHSAPARAR